MSRRHWPLIAVRGGQRLRLLPRHPRRHESSLIDFVDLLIALGATYRFPGQVPWQGLDSVLSAFSEGSPRKLHPGFFAADTPWQKGDTNQNKETFPIKEMHLHKPPKYCHLCVRQVPLICGRSCLKACDYVSTLKLLGLIDSLDAFSLYKNHSYKRV